MDGQTIRPMTVTELKEKLKELNLDTSGRKQTLCGRLMDHLGVGCSDDESTNSDYTEATAGKQLSKNYEKVNFTLRDIEDSVTSFSGDDHYDVSHWVREFEDIADTVGWSDLQKFVYAKQLLRGAAQLFVRGLVGIRSWLSLKEKLIDEFGKQLSAAEIHRIMRQRHKRPKESLNEYLYALIEIGNPIKLDEASVIEYFIDGIPDSRLNKAMLYEATTLKVLKEKIKIFEKIRGNFSSSNKTNPTNITNEHRPREDKKACFKCGSNTHLARECNRQGIVCFNCKQKGHFAKDCKDKPTKQVVKSEHVNILGKTLSKENPKSNMIFTNIKIKDKTFNALVDTGSELCIIRYDMVKMIGDVELKNEIVHLSGIGAGRLTTLGCFDAEIKLDDIIIKVTFYVVSEKDMVYSAILGSSIFEKVDMVIGQAGATFKKKGLLGSLKAVESTQNWGKPNPDVDWFDEFSALCCINIDGGVPNCPVNLTHLPKSVALTVEYWIRNFKPNKIAKSPIEMRIIVKDDIPVYQTPRRMSFGDRKFINEQIDLWLKDGILVPSTSEYAAPVVLVSKKDGTKRICCDYRKINEKIVRDNFPMTLIDEVLEQLQGANIFTTLDLANGFFHVPIEPSSRKYTAFVTHGGQFEFCYAPFGICNSPAVFGRYIQAVFRDLLKEGTVVIYMDDIVILAKDVDEGMVKLK
ncbi:uncharacterized protein LOC129242007 [Anastrepha obliqua]|uniref:uncharacterized protein LOC129242007 n=1 Tax=Anastrepha obliqua TaxID=95512 RepID=UPI00240A31BE|nr:uncharacterized protein LOC129242007 [Anastrepha obliqua]